MKTMPRRSGKHTVLPRTGLEGKWESGAKFPAKRFNWCGPVDQARNSFTTLVRMAPGAILASHRHADAEESYVLEGEIFVSGVLMHPGDYCRAEAGSLHTGVTTKTGCVFIAVASLHNEWFVEA